MTERNKYLSSSDDELLARTYELKTLAEGVRGIPDTFFTPEEKASILSELGETQPIIQELQRRGYGTV
jgi:hypothetical protein